MTAQTTTYDTTTVTGFLKHNNERRGAFRTWTWDIWKSMVWRYAPLEIPFLFIIPTIAGLYRAALYIITSEPKAPFWFFFVGDFDLPYISWGTWLARDWTITMAMAIFLWILAFRTWVKSRGVSASAKAWMWWLHKVMLIMLFSTW